MPVGKVVLLVLVLIAVAAGGSALAGQGHITRAAKPRPGGVAGRLAAQLSLPTAQVREALRAVRQERRTERQARRALRSEQRRSATRAERRKLRAERRAQRRQGRAERRALRGGRPALRALRRLSRVRDRLAPALAAKLELEPARVTAALRTILAERLDRAVARGRLTAAGRAAALACFDDASKCPGVRAALRHP